MQWPPIRQSETGGHKFFGRTRSSGERPTGRDYFLNEPSMIVPIRPTLSSVSLS